jgi:hypothetical protein
MNMTKAITTQLQTVGTEPKAVVTCHSAAQDEQTGHSWMSLPCNPMTTLAAGNVQCCPVPVHRQALLEAPTKVKGTLPSVGEAAHAQGRAAKYNW